MATLSLAHVINPAAGWYRGDLHAHTHHSDGHYAPRELVEVAREAGLDFLAITDHNGFKAFADLEPPADLVILPGVEVSLVEGHFNVFGMEESVPWLDMIWGADWQYPSQDRYESTTVLMRQAQEQGFLNSINHPLLKPWEWNDGATRLQHLHCLEIWNDPSWPENQFANPQAVALWTEWLNAGYRITAVGGSDYHRPAPFPDQDKPPERLGLPSTWVYAGALSGAAILGGLRRRRAYVSMGPQATFVAELQGTQYMMGDDLGERREHVVFKATVSGCEGETTLRLVRNGDVVAEVDEPGDAGSLEYGEDLDPATPAWHRLDVLDRRGQILLVTNPVYSGQVREPAMATFGESYGFPNG
jgi:hypothetical protein